MELATNTFTKGLLSDTNPMITGNDVMTDCLNGTLITMNGNEIMLLNDMGNRRVNNAFLPSGYLPVGMKEYGGIIYIAAYNPITNKSLIGSFPSPLKKFDFEDTKKKEFKFEKFFKEKADGEKEWNIEVDPDLGIRILKSDSFMISLTDDLNLRAGDKFTIYSSDLYDSPLETETYLIKDSEGNVTNIIENKYYAKDLITNFYNAEDRKAKNKKAISPKNRKYTLSVGVLNSQNEFVDITRSLCRWDEDKMINYDSSYSDIYKFNDGYFIAKSFSNGDLSETINDAKLIKTRQKIATNTYAYKLVGPMYLKISLNHVESFRYNVILEEVEEVPDGDNVVLQGKVRVEGYITYNCPDGVDDFSNDGNENYKTFQLGRTKLNGFDFFQVPEEGEIVKLTPTSIEENEKKCVYDSASNTYSLKIVKTYTKIIADNGGIFNYVLGVNVGITDDLYLKGLSTKGFLNFGLYGSGAIMFQTWKFYNDINKKESTLRYSLLAYPKRNLAFTDFKFKFIDLENREKEITFNAGDYYNDTIILNWDSLDFEFKKVYLVKLLYNVYDIESEKVTLTNQTIADISGNIESKSLYISQEEEEFIPTETYFDIPSYRCEGTTKILEKTKHTLVTNSKTNELYWKVDSNNIVKTEKNSFDCGCYACRITYVGGKVVDVPRNNYTNDDSRAFVSNQLEPYGSASLIEKVELYNVNPDVCFYRLPKLKTIIFLSEHIHIIPDVNLIYDCPNLETILFTEGLTETNPSLGTISSMIFGNCKVKSLTFPDSLQKLEARILVGESNGDVENPYYKGTVEPSITTLKFGTKIESFPQYGFFTKLTDLNEPKHSYSDKLEDVYCLRDDVLFKNGTLTILYFNACIHGSKATWHVPESCVSAYESAVAAFKKWIPESGTYNTDVKIKALTQEDIDLYKSEIYSSKINSESQELTNQDSEEQLSGPNEPYSEKSNNCRWFLTTGLFNNFFNDQSVLDFCNTDNEAFKAKMTINLDLDLKFNEDISDSNFDATGKLYSNENNKEVLYIRNNKKTIKCKILDSSFKNYSLYPYMPSNYNIQFNNMYQILFKDGSIANNSNFGTLLDKNLGNKFKGYFSFNTTEATGIITWEDICKGTTDTLVSGVKEFIPLTEALSKIGNNRIYGLFYSTQFWDKEIHDNYKDFLYLYLGTSDENIYNKLYIDIDNLDREDIMRLLNMKINRNQMCLYLSTWEYTFKSNKVYWITNNNEWTSFSKKLEEGEGGERESISNFLKRVLEYDVIYYYSNNNTNYYVCREYLYGKYENGISIKILLPIKLNNFYINFYNIGNLLFNYKTINSLKPITINCTLELPVDFTDKINSTSQGNLSIYKKDDNIGIDEDYLGKPLNKDTIYYEENSKLYPTHLLSVFKVIEEEGGNNNLLAVDNTKVDFLLGDETTFGIFAI